MFIAVEGADGTGTTTQADRLVARMSETYGAERVWKTCEPTDGPVGVLIRGMLKAGGKGVHNDTVRYLFRADRIEHFRNEIRPRLMEGVHVVTDRYLLSTLVYQTVAELRPSMSPKRWPSIIDGMKRMWREMINRDEIYDADMTLVLHLDPGKASGRIGDRGQKREIYEEYTFQQKVSDAYRLWVENDGGDIPFRYFLVAADGDINTVHERCCNLFKERFGKMP